MTGARSAALARPSRLNTSRSLVVVAVVALVAASVVVVGVGRWRRAGDTDHGAANVGIVVHAVDGDTADVEINGTVERVRFIGIDTPELHTDAGPPECFGLEAAARTAALLPVGTAVTLSGDVVGRDDYGRLLAYVHRTSDDAFVNELLLLEGYARPLRIAPNTTFAAAFAEATTSAERAGRGLWTACRRG